MNMSDIRLRHMIQALLQVDPGIDFGKNPNFIPLIQRIIDI